MWVEFESLKPTSRIWIYQANRPLTALEEIDLSSQLSDFCDEWRAHGQPLRASFVIAHQQFLVLAADEDYQLPSGCSIDASVRVLKDWQGRNGIDFFDRSQIALRTGNGLLTQTLTAIKEQIARGEVTESTLTFDNLVPSKGDWQTRWEIPLEKSWLARYLPKSSAQPTP